MKTRARERGLAPPVVHVFEGRGRSSALCVRVRVSDNVCYVTFRPTLLTLSPYHSLARRGETGPDGRGGGVGDFLPTAANRRRAVPATGLPERADGREKRYGREVKKVDIYGGQNPREPPLYTLAEATRVVRLNPATLRTWALGRSYPTRSRERICRTREPEESDRDPHRNRTHDPDASPHHTPEIGGASSPRPSTPVPRRNFVFLAGTCWWNMLLSTPPRFVNPDPPVVVMTGETHELPRGATRCRCQPRAVIRRRGIGNRSGA
jgi:hypothetical protein